MPAGPGADLDDAADLLVAPAVEWVRVRGVTVDVEPAGGVPTFARVRVGARVGGELGARGDARVQRGDAHAAGASGGSAQSTRATRPGASNLTTVPTAVLSSAWPAAGSTMGSPVMAAIIAAVCWAAAAGPALPVSTVSSIAWSWVDTRE